MALVTGGTSGIGRATAGVLAAAGAKVAVAGRSEGKGTQAVGELEASGAEVLFVAGDVSREADVAAMVAQTLERFGRLDMACNAAGADTMEHLASTSTATADLEEGDWDRIVDVNLKGTWLSMKHELAPMVQAGRGSIVNVSSVGGLVGIANSSAYCAAKHGVIGLTRAAALEVAPQGIRVNAVCPGTVDTPMLERVLDAQPQRRAAYGSADPMGRIAQPAELAQVMAFLCSPGASYLTGAAIPVDGGWTAQ